MIAAVATATSPTTARPTWAAAAAFARRLGLDTVYLVTGLPMGIPAFTVVVTGWSLSLGLAITLIGLPIALVTVALSRALATVERRRAELVLGPHSRPATGRGHRGRCGRACARSSPTRRPGRTWPGTCCCCPSGSPASRSPSPPGRRPPACCSCPPGGGWGRDGWASTSGYSRSTAGRRRWPGRRSGCCPSRRRWPWCAGPLRGRARRPRSSWVRGRAGERVEKLPSRAPAPLTPRRRAPRIERDLHDGAQARIVALAMDLGMAERRSARTRRRPRAVGSAREDAGRALGELRELVRGIGPASSRPRPGGGGRALGRGRARCRRRPRRAWTSRARRRRSRPPPTSWSPRRSRTRPSTSGGERRGAAVADGRPPGGGGLRRRRGRRRPPSGGGLTGLIQPRGGTRRHAAGGEPGGRAHRGAGGGPVRAVIAEDLALLRDGLTPSAGDSGIEVVAAVENGDALVRRARPPPGHGYRGCPPAPDVHRRGRARGARRAAAVPGPPVLVLSAYVERTYATELLADGQRRGRLPAQGPGGRPARLRGGGPPRGRGWHGARPRGGRAAHGPAARPAVRWRSSRRASARCSGSWPRAAATRGSPASSS